MAVRRSDTDSLLLVAATTFAVLALQSFFSRRNTERSVADEPQPIGDTDVPPPATFTRELAQSGRGRHSSSPLQIPWTGWKDVLWRTYEQINEDRLLAIAAGVVFFGLLAVFPAITALVSCYGLFADASTISDNLQTLALMLPDGSFQIVQDQIARVLANGQAKLGLTFLFGLALALWSANAGVKAVIDALNVVYGEREKRSFIKLNMLSLTFTAGAIAALLLMVSAVVALPLTLDRIGLATDSKTIISLSRWPLLLLVVVLALGILYRSNFGNYSATYGSLGAAIGLMMWMWMSAIIVLCGAELNSEIEHQTAVDTTVGPGRPMGARGAAMADTLGRAST
jgi:membrane protein